MQIFSRLPIRAKLILLITVTAASALCIASAAFIVTDILASRTALGNQLEVLSQVVADNSIAAVTFDDHETASDVLKTVSREPAVLRACIFDRSNSMFAIHESPALVDNASSLPLPNGVLLTIGTVFRKGYVEQITEIRDADEPLGTVYLLASADGLKQRILSNLKLVGFTLIAALVVALLIATSFEKLISRPIVKLAQVANEISLRDDYSVRVVESRDDEIGELYTAFNNMLVQIESNRDELRKAHSHLEDRVHERTFQLTQANKHLKLEIEEKAMAQRELERVQCELIDTARRAGMADVATGVLHNVGNVLNSVNVSAGMILERVRYSPSVSLERSAHLLRDTASDSIPTAELMSNPPDRMLKLADFLQGIAKKCDAENTEVRQEVDRLVSNIDHIKKIVASQQSFAKSSGIVTKIQLEHVFEDALELHDVSLARHGIDVTRIFAAHKPLYSDQHRILQILVNLVFNAKQAIEELAGDSPRITLRINDIDGERVSVQVSDTGVGVRPENLKKIFSYGFTTKAQGHGFGLHACALAAYELGGSLSVKSQGEGLGATFTLVLPYQYKQEA
ncbi:ATP-binding protein [Aureliella helgolandensis]|uniref:histidine kinase n=1 Tax=Aureliella helgolandensis TaxID=2527968 RepID=A0A518G983_9BACT|nr:ATP-binding protein [Aureliella helgolandensis]QDV25130.1 Sensor protein ZraS [Aureliella helgolandensis]